MPTQHGIYWGFRSKASVNKNAVVKNTLYRTREAADKARNEYARKTRQLPIDFQLIRLKIDKSNENERVTVES